MNKYSVLLAQEKSNDGLDVQGGQNFDGPAQLIWLTGKQELRPLGADNVTYAGGFYLPLVYRHGDKVVSYLPEGANLDEYQEVDLSHIPGWKKSFFVNGEGRDVHGWLGKRAELSFIRSREAWENYVDVPGNRPQVTRFTKYDDAKAKSAPGKSPRSVMQVLAVIKGTDFPVIFTVKGYAQRDFKANVLDALTKNITKPIGAALKGNINYRIVNCMVEPSSNADGSPKFITAGSGANSKMIVTPAYAGPLMPKGGWGDANAHLAKLDEVFVGDDEAQRNNELYEKFEDWAQSWADLKGEQLAVAERSEPAGTEKQDLAKLANAAGM